MELRDAIEQIEEIQNQIARTESYRGFISVPLAISGMCGLLAAALQPPAIAGRGPMAFLAYWCIVGAVCGSISACGMIPIVLRRDRGLVWRQTMHLVHQFTPAVVAGAAMALALPRVDPSLVRLLPGLWALCFSLRISVPGPLLVNGSVWVGAWYFCCGTVLLLWQADPARIPGWTIGIPFGLGQLASAMLVYWNLERKR